MRTSFLVILRAISLPGIFALSCIFAPVPFSRQHLDPTFPMRPPPSISCPLLCHSLLFTDYLFRFCSSSMHISSLLYFYRSPRLRCRLSAIASFARLVSSAHYRHCPRMLCIIPQHPNNASRYRRLLVIQRNANTSPILQMPPSCFGCFGIPRARHRCASAPRPPRSSRAQTSLQPRFLVCTPPASEAIHRTM